MPLGRSLNGTSAAFYTYRQGSVHWCIHFLGNTYLIRTVYIHAAFAAFVHHEYVRRGKARQTNTRISRSIYFANLFSNHCWTYSSPRFETKKVGVLGCYLPPLTDHRSRLQPPAALCSDHGFPLLLLFVVCVFIFSCKSFWDCIIHYIRGVYSAVYTD